MKKMLKRLCTGFLALARVKEFIEQLEAQRKKPQ